MSSISTFPLITVVDELKIDSYKKTLDMPEEHSYKETYLGQEIKKLFIPHIFDTNGKELSDDDILIKNNNYVIVPEIEKSLTLVKYEQQIRLPVSLTELILCCKENVICIPEFLRKLYIYPMYTSKIPFLHNNLQILNISGESCKFIHLTKLPNELVSFSINYDIPDACQIKIPIFPPSLKKLELLCKIKGNLPLLPKTLEYFSTPFGYGRKVNYPKNLIELHIGKDSSSLCICNIPKSLEILSIMPYVMVYNVKIDMPPNLKSISIHPDNVFQSITLHDKIEKIFIGSKCDNITFSHPPKNLSKFIAPYCSNISTIPDIYKKITHMTCFNKQDCFTPDFIEGIKECTKLEVLFWYNRFPITPELSFPSSLKKIVLSEKVLKSYIQDSVKKIVVSGVSGVNKNKSEKQGGCSITHCFNKEVQKRIENNSIEIIHIS